MLAAGQSRRMGSCKQLLLLGGRPLIVHGIESITAAGVTNVVVVVGRRGETVADAVRSFGVAIAYNLEPDSDMAASVRVGMQRVSANSTGVFISLADHPAVSPVTYNTLLQWHDREPDSILIPVHGGK